jgi:hypothetical protein
MASTHKSLRSGTANKRPTTSIADGQIALNTNVASPGLYFKDSTGASIIKIGPVHVGTTAPNVAPAGSSGNSTGEAWLDTSLTPNGWKVWTGAAWTNATPVGSDTVQGLLELATNAETQAGSDTARAVTPAGLQSKVSDSTSTTSSTTIASSTAVKSAYDLANAALPKSGGTVTGNLEIGTSGSLTFEGATADAFETTLAVVDPTADRTITLPNVTGTVVTTGDTGTVTSTMILDGTILNADVNASAAIAGTKISPDFGSQNAVTTGTSTAASFIPTSSTVPTNGVYLPAANNVAISTNSAQRLYIAADGKVGINSGSPQGQLHVEGGQTYMNRSGAGNQQVLQLNNSDTTAGTQIVKLAFGSSGSTKASINAAVYGNDYLAFNTGSDTERMRLTGTGLVGVGTSSPGTILDVVGSGNPTLTVRGSDGAYTGIINIQAAGGGVSSINATGGGNALKIETNSVERVRIDSSGRVGIGTSAPVAALDVSDSSVVNTQSPKIYLCSENGVDKVACEIRQGRYNKDVLVVSSNQSLSANLFNAIENGTSRFVITGAGNVGIGTTSPAALLHLSATAGNQELRFSDTTNSAMGRIYESNGLAIISETNHGISFQTNATGRGGFEAGGNFFIDTVAIHYMLTLPTTE